MEETIYTKENLDFDLQGIINRSSFMITNAIDALSDGDFINAERCCSDAYENDPDEVAIYLIRLLIELRITKIEDIENQEDILDEKENYKKLTEYPDSFITRNIVEYNLRIKDKIYQRAINRMKSMHTIEDYEECAALFKKVSGYREADKKYERCINLKETEVNQELYNSAMSLVRKKKYKKAIEVLEQIPYWENSTQIVMQCKEKIREKKDLIRAIVICVVACAGVAALALLSVLL